MLGIQASQATSSLLFETGSLGSRVYALAPQHGGWAYSCSDLISGDSPFASCCSGGEHDSGTSSSLIKALLSRLDYRAKEHKLTSSLKHSPICCVGIKQHVIQPCGAL